MTQLIQSTAVSYMDYKGNKTVDLFWSRSLALLLQTLWAHSPEKCGYGDAELFRRLGSCELAAIPQTTSLHHVFSLSFSWPPQTTASASRA